MNEYNLNNNQICFPMETKCLYLRLRKDLKYVIRSQTGTKITIPYCFSLISAADWFYLIPRMLKLASRANKNIYYHPGDLETAFYKNDHSTQLPMVYCHAMLNCNRWFEELSFVERDFKNCDFWYGFGTNTRDIFLLNKNDLKIISGPTLSGELGYNIVLTNPDKVYCWKR